MYKRQEWGLRLKSPMPREAPKSTSEERAIWDEKTMLAALQTMTDPDVYKRQALHQRIAELKIQHDDALAVVKDLDARMVSLKDVYQRQG